MPAPAGPRRACFDIPHILGRAKDSPHPEIAPCNQHACSRIHGRLVHSPRSTTLGSRAPSSTAATAESMGLFSRSKAPAAQQTSSPAPAASPTPILRTGSNSSRRSSGGSSSSGAERKVGGGQRRRRCLVAPAPAPAPSARLHALSPASAGAVQRCRDSGACRWRGGGDRRRRHQRRQPTRRQAFQQQWQQLRRRPPAALAPCRRRRARWRSGTGGGGGRSGGRRAAPPAAERRAAALVPPPWQQPQRAARVAERAAAAVGGRGGCRGRQGGAGQRRRVRPPLPQGACLLFLLPFCAALWQRKSAVGGCSLQTCPGWLPPPLTPVPRTPAFRSLCSTRMRSGARLAWTASAACWTTRAAWCAQHACCCCAARVLLEVRRPPPAAGFRAGMSGPAGSPWLLHSKALTNLPSRHAAHPAPAGHAAVAHRARRVRQARDDGRRHARRRLGGLARVCRLVPVSAFFCILFFH